MYVNSRAIVNADTIRQDFALATDLDGTFLHGTLSEKHQLYQIFHLETDKRPKLIFVTGRGLESVYPLLYDPIIPKPDYIISDVGATVVAGPHFDPVHPLQGDIQSKWPGAHNVYDAIKHLDGLRLQGEPQERRVSFYSKENEIPKELFEIAEELGCDVLFSGGKYLDILPKGVSKGTTLSSLIELEKIECKVVVAGDTLNDLSLFQTSFSGVVMGNSESSLVKKTQDLPETYIASKEGVNGIIEGLQHYELIGNTQTRPPVHPKTQDSNQLVMVYHRLPFEEKIKDGAYLTERHQSPNGIIPTLTRFFANGEEGLWVAWSKSQDRKENVELENTQIDQQSFPNLKISRVWLTDQDVDIFYKRFSKEAFWLLLHSLSHSTKFSQEHWDRYVEVNELFAEKIASEANQGALVWIHDYNLWMVPGTLRRMRPDLRIAFFHHTPFPSDDSFAIIPWRREILNSLLQCDYVGFHIPRYVENFVDALRSHGPVEILESRPSTPRFMSFGCALGSTEEITKIRAVENTLGVGAHPVGIDVQMIRNTMESDQTQRKIKQLKKEFSGRRMILSVERLDFTKGPLEKLEAYERLLESHPELHEKIQFVAIWTPPDPTMEVYQELQEQVNQWVGQINGKFATYQWTPIRYLFQSFPFDEVVAYYAASDIAWITPLRDGLNLVAKEFVATKSIDESEGVLVLSEFAGSSVELHGALLTNPYDINDMTRVLKRAIDLKPETRRLHMERLFQIVNHFNVSHWADRFLRYARRDAK